MKNFLILLLSFITICCNAQDDKSHKASNEKEIKTGADILISEKLDLIKNKKLGIVTNHTATLFNNKAHLVDSLNSMGVKISVLFGPEHGIRGNAPAGKHIDNTKDAATGIPVISLYGKNRKPSAEMLKDVDILIFDIQDVGARFYTYISTLYYTLQSGAENNVPVIVLDRPNPVGSKVEGPILKEELKSFVGIETIPVRHGMTVGELAELFNDGRLGKDLKAKLTVIKVENWERDKYLDNYNYTWLAPSPNIPDVETAVAYSGTCFIEGTNSTEGRGTDKPFLYIGAPYIKSNELISELKSLSIEGIDLSPITFTPKDIDGKVTNPKNEGELCNGISVNVKDRNNAEIVNFGLKLVYAIKKLYPNDFKFKSDFFDKLTGDKNIRIMLEANKTPEEIITYYTPELNKFKELRKKYLLY